MIHQNNLVNEWCGGLSPCTVEEVSELVVGSWIVINFQNPGGEKDMQLRGPLTIE
jgi:hypothetical protein